MTDRYIPLMVLGAMIIWDSLAHFSNIVEWLPSTGVPFQYGTFAYELGGALFWGTALILWLIILVDSL